METTQPSPANPVSPPRSRGRVWLWLGIGLCLVTFSAYFVQTFLLKHLVTPWYSPILYTVSAVLALVSVRQRPTWTRAIVSLVLTLWCAGGWSFMLSISRLPEYKGPLAVDQQIPEFTTTFADGSTFTDQDLKKGNPTVLVFYRGHW